MLKQLLARVLRDSATAITANPADRLQQRLASVTSTLAAQQRAITAARQALAETLQQAADEIGTWPLDTVPITSQLQSIIKALNEGSIVEAQDTLPELQTGIDNVLENFGTSLLERKRRRLLNGLHEMEINRY